MDLIQEVLTFSRDYVNGNQTKERKQKIAAAYLSLLGERLRIGCSTCYIEAIFKIKKYMEKKPCSYRLKPGALLTAFGDESKTCTNANLTDELAEYHLSTNPGCAKLFSVIPAPPKELEIVVPEVKATEAKATEVKATEVKTESKPKGKRTPKVKK
jgi:hypothetical protein